VGGGRVADAGINVVGGGVLSGVREGIAMIARRLEVCVRIVAPTVTANDEDDGSISFECVEGSRKFTGRFHAPDHSLMSWEKWGVSSPGDPGCIIAAGATQIARIEDDGPRLEDLVLWAMLPPRVGLVARGATREADAKKTGR
jgi:hypothetical protein